MHKEGHNGNKKIFTRKPGVGNIYRWSPDPDIVKRKLKPKKGKALLFCTATPFNTGQDFIVKYVFDLIIVDSKATKESYVECGYVD